MFGRLESFEKVKIKHCPALDARRIHLFSAVAPFIHINSAFPSWTKFLQEWRHYEKGQKDLLYAVVRQEIYLVLEELHVDSLH